MIDLQLYWKKICSIKVKIIIITLTSKWSVWDILWANVVRNFWNFQSQNIANIKWSWNLGLEHIVVVDTANKSVHIYNFVLLIMCKTPVEKYNKVSLRKNRKFGGSFATSHLHVPNLLPSFYFRSLLLSRSVGFVDVFC